MEAICSSEMSDSLRTIRRFNPEDATLRCIRRVSVLIDENSRMLSRSKMKKQQAQLEGKYESDSDFRRAVDCCQTVFQFGGVSDRCYLSTVALLFIEAFRD
jgi:hypothetical protein